MTTSRIQEDLTIEGDLVTKGGGVSIGGKVTGNVTADLVDILVDGR